MTAPPQVNCTLEAVGTAGVADDFNGEDPGAPKWAEGDGGYYREKVLTVQTAGGPDVQTQRTLWIGTDTADAATVKKGDVLTVALEQGRGRFTARANAIARASLPGVPPEIQTTKIDLGEPTAI